MKTKKLRWLALAAMAFVAIVAVRHTRFIKQKAFEQEMTVQAPPALSPALVQATVRVPDAAQAKVAKPAFTDSELKIIHYYADSLRNAMTEHPEVKVSKEDIENSILPIFAQISLERQNLENSRTRVIEQTPSQTHLKIPAYADEGAKLEKAFYAQVAYAIGVAKAMDLEDAVGGEIAQMSKFWGEAEQDIVIQQKPDGAYSFEHSIAPHSLTARIMAMTGLSDPTASSSSRIGNTAWKNDLGEYADKTALLPTMPTKS